MIAPVGPLPILRVEKKKTKQNKKVTRESKLLLADPNTLAEDRDDIATQGVCAANVSSVGEQSQLPPPKRRVWSTYVQSEMLPKDSDLKNRGHRGLEEKPEMTGSVICCRVTESKW